LKGAPGGKDLVGEVLGRVCLRRCEAGCRGGSRNRFPALQAELRAGGQFGLTLGTDRRQTTSALHTELGARRVFMLAPRTLHESCHTRPRRRWSTLLHSALKRLEGQPKALFGIEIICRPSEHCNVPCWATPTRSSTPGIYVTTKSHDSLGSSSGVASKRSASLLYPRIADEVIALPRFSESCQVQT